MHNSWFGLRPHLTFSHTYFRKLYVKFMIWYILILIALLRAWSGVTRLVQRWSGVLWETYSIRLNIIFSGLTKYFNCNLTCHLTFKILTLILFNDCRTFLLMLALRSWFLIKWYPLVDSFLYYYHFSALQRNDIFRRDQPTPFSRCTGVTIQADGTQTVRKSLTTCSSSTNCSCAHLHWLFLL